MQQVQLADELYKQAQLKASEEGHASVDEYTAEAVTLHLTDDAEGDENLDHRFTPEVIAGLEQISAEMHAGKTVSMEEGDKHLVDVRQAWLKDHAG
jgi:hypothetical protein